MLREDQIESGSTKAGRKESHRAKNRAVETAKKLLENNIPEKIIAECTGLSPKQIKSL